MPVARQNGQRWSSSEGDDVAYGTHQRLVDSTLTTFSDVTLHLSGGELAVTTPPPPPPHPTPPLPQPTRQRAGSDIRTILNRQVIPAYVAVAYRGVLCLQPIRHTASTALTLRLFVVVFARVLPNNLICTAVCYQTTRSTDHMITMISYS